MQIVDIFILHGASIQICLLHYPQAHKYLEHDLSLQYSDWLLLSDFATKQETVSVQLL